MAKAFKPSAYYSKNNERKSVYYKNFIELKKNLRQLIDESDDGKVTVYRQRLGKWAEWMEVYEKAGKKLIITKQTWL